MQFFWDGLWGKLKSRWNARENCQSNFSSSLQRASEDKAQSFASLTQIYRLSFSALGAAYGTAKSGTGIAAMSVMRPELIMKSIIPVVMAGIIAIYGLVVAVLIANNISERVSLYK